MREVFITRKGLLIGRGENCDVNIQNMYASRRHAFVVPLNENLVIYDLGSTNGTYWREPMSKEWIRVNEVALIHNGTQVKIGDTILMLRIA